MSMSQNSSESSSVPTVTETPENQIIDQISGVASQLAGQMYSWAQGVFAQTSQITNQAVGNFLNVSQQMLGLSNNITGQYNNVFAPENAQLVADANSYASPTRMGVDMGQAGATQAQAGAQALANNEASLRSFGIDPSSGRYAALDKAAAVQNAANVAGAENTQRNSDIATGQRLRSEAVQVGATMPAAIANLNNTAIQANTGAVNSSLANANTGANLMELPNKFLGTAMGVKMPLQGQNSQSHSNGTSSSPQQPPRPSSGGGGGGNGAGGNGGGGNTPAWMPQHGGPGGGPSMTSYNFGNGQNWNDPTGQNYDPMSGIDPNSFDGGGIYQPDPNGAMGDIGAPTNDAFQDFGSSTGASSDPSGAGAFGSNFGQDFGGNTFGSPDVGTYSGSQGAQDTQFGDINYDPNSNPMQDTSGMDGGSWSDPSTSANTDWGTGADQYTGAGDTSSPDSDYYAGDYSGGSSDDMGGAYARGGAIPPAYASGGAIPQSMSPSAGRQVDDVRGRGPRGPVNLNANEFVIPQDVALWKGQEFFQNLIDQSRKKRVTAPAKPQAMPVQNMR